MASFRTNDGARIHYEDHGQGSPIVFVPGWCMTTKFWREQVAGLSDGFRCITYDPRSHGKSENVAYGHRIARHARDLYDLIRLLDLDSVTLVGWSTGACVVLSYTELFAHERVARLVLVDQSPCNTNRPGWSWGFGAESDAAAFIHTIETNHRAAATGLITSMFAEPPTPDQVEWMLAEALQTPATAAAELERDDLHQDWRDMLPTIDVPVLVMAGKHSRVFPNEALHYMAKAIPNASLEVFATSGHCPFLEQPAEFNLALQEFVQTR